MGDRSNVPNLKTEKHTGGPSRTSRPKNNVANAKTRPEAHKAKNAADSGKGKSGKGNRNKKTNTKHKKTVRRKPIRDERATLRWLTKSLENIKNRQERDQKSICLPTCSNIVKFTVAYCFVLLIRFLLGRYMEGVLHNLSLLYLIKRPELEFIVGAEKIGFAVSVLLIAYYGNGMHKPLAMLCGTFMCAVGSLICSVPHFVSNVSAIVSSEYHEAGLCQTGRNKSSIHQYQCEAHESRPEATETDVFSILCAGYFVVGVGSALYATLGVIYIEENGEKKRNVLLYGAILSIYGLGDLIGSLVVWGLDTLPADLNGELSIKEWEAGAWWLGFILLGGLFLFSGIIFLPFPKWIREPGWLMKRRQRKFAKYEKLLQSELHKLERKKRKQERKKRRDKIKANKAEYRKELLRKRAAKQEGADNKAFQSEKEPASSSERNSVMASNSTISEPVVPNIDSTSPNISDNEETLGQSDSSDKEGSQNGDVSGAANVPTRRRRRRSAESSNTTSTEDKTSKTDIEGIEIAGPSQLPPAAKKVGFVEEKESELEGESIAERAIRREKTEKRKDRLGRNLRDLPRHMVYLFRRPTYMLTLVGTVLFGYQAGGWRATLPAFTLAAFPSSGQPDAPILLGISYGTASAVGAICGAVVVYRLRLNLIRQMIMVLVSVGVHIGLTAVLMPLTCDPLYQAARTNSSTISWNVECNRQCDCTGVQYEPICSQTGVVFPSSCHAGCREFGLDPPVDPVNQYLRFTDCSCVPDTGEASRGWCDVSCPESSVFYLIVCLASVAHSFGYISLMLIYLRSVPEKLRSISFGLAVWITYLGAIVPGKAVFSYIQGATCLYQAEDCYEEPTCWFFNQINLRYLQHGSLIAIQLGAIFFFGFALFVLRKKVYARRPLGITSKGDGVDNGKDDGKDSDDTTVEVFDNLGFAEDVEMGKTKNRKEEKPGQEKNRKGQRGHSENKVKLSPDAPSDDSRL